MTMENASVLFKRIMLGLLLALLALTLALVVREGLQSHSYLLALAAGLVWALAAFLLLRKRPLRRSRLKPPKSLRPGKLPARRRTAASGRPLR